MAFVVHRGGGRWEVRESATTPAGPRARTLATFRTLTEEIAERAAARAAGATSANDVLAAARRAGAPVAGTTADVAAAELLRLLDHGVPLSERLRRPLVERLGPAPSVPHQARAASLWAAYSPVERGEILRDLLDFTDAFPPPRRRRPTRLPRLEPVPGT